MIFHNVLLILFPFETVSSVFYQNHVNFSFQCTQFKLQKNPKDHRFIYFIFGYIGSSLLHAGSL